MMLYRNPWKIKSTFDYQFSHIHRNSHERIEIAQKYSIIKSKLQITIMNLKYKSFNWKKGKSSQKAINISFFNSEKKFFFFNSFVMPYFTVGFYVIYQVFSLKKVQS
jgi:hypothetical protein